MSFSGLNLNSPPVVGALGVGCFAALPLLKGTFEKQSIPWSVVQITNLVAYGVGFYSVTQPGRNDSKNTKKPNKKQGKSKSNTPSTAKDSSVPATASNNNNNKKKKKSTGPKVRTLMPPDGWAFLVWAPIFVGECLMVGTQVALPETSPLAPIVREITGPYVFAQVFQTLWTASFRPNYTEGVYKYIAALNLSGIALSLSFCHRAYTSKRDRYTTMDFILNFLPISLHFGWTTAASLVNWNASYAIEKNATPDEIAYLGHASVAAATVVGTGVTLRRKAPFYGTVIAWALSAIASGLTKRIDEGEEEDEKDTEFLEAAKLQRTLSVVGATICTVAAMVVAIGKKKQCR